MNLKRTLTWLFLALLLLAVVALGVRSVRAMRGPALQPWHTHIPVELSADELDAADWKRYLAQEQAIFDDIRANVTQRLEPDARVPYNRYFEGNDKKLGRSTNSKCRIFFEGYFMLNH